LLMKVPHKLSVSLFSMEPQKLIEELKRGTYFDASTSSFYCLSAAWVTSMK
jgi:hypothetical protein